LQTRTWFWSILSNCTYWFLCSNQYPLHSGPRRNGSFPYRFFSLHISLGGSVGVDNPGNILFIIF